jgi:regulator of CtrA degradation
MPKMTAAPSFATADRVLNFARSELFERTFKEGMALVEEVAAYLDGPGRAASKRLPRAAALAYAGESMRLTTRLMQVASWLLVQRALRDGTMNFSDAQDDKYRFARRPEPAPFAAAEELPPQLNTLMARCDAIYERTRRLDESLYEEAPAEETAQVGAAAQLARLQAAFKS